MPKEATNQRRIELRPFEVTVPTADGREVAERVGLMVPMEWDPELNEWLLTAEAEDLIETTKARRMGLLLPAELLALREQLDLTQSQIGELLKIGEKTWTRWETGRQRPSQSLNLLLRALQTGLLSTYDLKTLDQPAHDWSTAVLRKDKAEREMTVAMDFAMVGWRDDQDISVAGNTEQQPLAA